MTKDWIWRTNVYEVNLRQYTEEGTINAFATHLHRLRDMGVHTLWFMPLTRIAQKNKKGSLGSYYACSDYTAIDREFGTMDDWKTLVTEAHQMGFKVIIDWVANHTGWDHKWTGEHPEWYKKDEHTGDFKKASGMDDIIELDFNQPAVRAAMIDAMRFWVEQTGIDGFRCDLAFWVALPFWIEAKNELEKIRPLFWLGELDMLDNPEYMQVFDAAYTWRWMHQAEGFYKKQLSLQDLLEVLQQYHRAPGIKAWFTSNHDENSWNGTEYEKYGDMAKLLAVFSATWKGLPLIYSGQELPNHKRLQFFEKDPIGWSDTTELHQFYKTILHLREVHPALHAHASAERIETGGHNRIFTFKRTCAEEEIIVVLNFSDQSVDLDFSLNIDNVLFASPEAKAIGGHLHLEGWGWMILK